MFSTVQANSSWPDEGHGHGGGPGGGGGAGRAGGDPTVCRKISGMVPGAREAGGGGGTLFEESLVQAALLSLNPAIFTASWSRTCTGRMPQRHSSKLPVIIFASF